MDNMLICVECGEELNPKRRALGYTVCLDCGEHIAKHERKSWTIVPMHKSNYMRVNKRDDLLGINNKGGMVR